MQVQLLKRRQVTVHGQPRNLQPGDWADVGRQIALRWIAEGIVWHHPDGRMCKIKRRDFSLEWPVKD